MMMSDALAPIHWQWKPFNELSGLEVAAIFQLRQAVFIVEQNCVFHDIDGIDDQAIHLMAWHDQQLVATMRLFANYQPYHGHCSLGRICSHPDFRRYGIGRALVQKGVEYIDQVYPQQQTQIGAQRYLEKFYQEFGFKTCSDMYLEDGIEHVLMRRPAKDN